MEEDFLARLAIRQLIEDYALAADSADGARAAKLFTTDGAMRISMNPEHPESFTTSLPSEMDRAWAGLKKYSATSHVIAAHSATVTALDSALATTRCVAHHLLDAPSGRTDTVMHIEYSDALRKVDGAWLFFQRHLRIKALARFSVLPDSEST